LIGALGLGCDPANKPETIDSQTNWLKSCQIDQQCTGGGKCVCGTCTATCSEDTACAELAGSSCVGAAESGAIAQCGGTHPPGPGLCMPRCDTAPCAKNQMCVAGVCTPVPTAGATVVVDASVTHQMLVGFGATVAYIEDEITSHPQADALYPVLFGELGLDILRLRDRYQHSDDDLTISRTLVDAASTSLGHAPSVFMTSWSPPAALKASGAAQCGGNPDTCTLVKTAAGAFDYTGFAKYLRDSLDAYAQIGVVPDYFGIQNNPNWVPTAAEPGEACRFLPTEGTVPVLVRGVNTRVSYPGYDQAQAATSKALVGLKALPRILGPEASDFESVADYIPSLDFSQIEALSHHLYGDNPETIDIAALAAIGELAAENSRPVFQTEMQADGLGTALLIHYTTVIEGGSAYIQSSLTGPSSGPTANPQALVGLDTTTFVREDPYYAFQHYALHTDPGWTRVDALSNVDSLLASAWLSPTGTALTVVLVNSGNSEVDTKLAVPSGIGGTTAVTRTVFGGSERGVPLGSLSDAGILSVPARAIVTVAFTP
jgi:hypothetical protein